MVAILDCFILDYPCLGEMYVYMQGRLRSLTIDINPIATSFAIGLNLRGVDPMLRWSGHA